MRNQRKGVKKSGWIRTSAILTATSGYAYDSRKAFTTYRRPGGSVFGSVSVGAQLVILGESSGFTQFRYPLNSGGFKFAWAPTSTVRAAINGGNSTRYAKVKAVADEWNGRYWTTNSKPSNSSGSTSKYYYGIQCKEFGSFVYCRVTGVTCIGQTKSNKYQISYSSANTTCIGTTAAVTASSAKSLLSKTTAGDFLQMRRRSSGGPHSAIVMSVSSSGVTVLECNADGHCGVKVNTYSFATWASKNNAFSVYRPK